MMKRFFKDKSGSSLVLVMICMSFLILLAGAVITTTITNIYLKSSQKATQENFYQTDSILDAIAAGIQNESSQASAKAYQNALGEYNSSLTSSGSPLNDKYAEDFLTDMLKVLTGNNAVVYDPSGKTDYYYLDSVLMGYLSEEQAKSYIKHDKIQETDTETKGKMILDGDALILEDVKVLKAHDTQKDYETTLTTDIRIEVPTVSTEAHSEYLNYAVLADNQVIANNGLMTAHIKGNVYAGTVKRNATQEETQAGIVIGGGATLKINADQIITRGDVRVSNGQLNIGKSASSDKNAELWAENIITTNDSTGNGGNVVDINASSYIADDMEITGNNDSVSLKGKYYGYNYVDDYSKITTSPAPKKLSTTAAYSSSISINGHDDSLEMTGLSELLLAGRTFISKKATNENDVKSEDNPDIELGESLAVKSGQLSYFVGAAKSDESPDAASGFVKKVSVMDATKLHINGDPAEGCYGTYDTDTKKGLACYYFQIGDTQYLFDYPAYEEQIGILDANGNTDDIIKEMIDSGEIDPKQPLKLYSRLDKMVDADPIHYFYLSFADSKGASKFFNRFYNESAQQQVYDTVNKQYVDAVGIQIPSFSGNKIGYILSSGNIMYSDNSQKGDDGKGKICLRLENTSQDPSAAFLQFAKESSKLYMSKQLALVDDYEKATTSKKWRLYEDGDANNTEPGTLTKSGVSDKTNLFNTLVKVSDIPNGTVKGNYKITRDNGEVVNCGFIISDTDITWPDDYVAGKGSIVSQSGDLKDSDPCFILTKGKVTVNEGNGTEGFKGLIISGDDVELAQTKPIVQSDSEAIEKLFEVDQSQSSPVFYNLMQEYFRKSVEAAIGSDGSSTNSNNVSFENWKKNG